MDISWQAGLFWRGINNRKKVGPLVTDAGDHLTERALFLCRITRKKVEHLEGTAARLFLSGKALEVSEVEQWLAEPQLSERLDVFITRFGRLQDTVADNLIPALLELAGEQHGPMLDNLDKAEKFGWISSSEEWILYRKLRNQMLQEYIMAHEYLEDRGVLTDALEAGRQSTPALARLCLAVVEETERRL